MGAIAAGGALGATARFALAQLIPGVEGAFPWATFCANVSGSFALGVLLILVIDRFPSGRVLRPFLVTGFLGAFTTFSTFALEVDLLIRNGDALKGTVYALASVAAGLVAVWSGILVGRLAARRS
jgi:CrcB protein